VRKASHTDGTERGIIVGHVRFHLLMPNIPMGAAVSGGVGRAQTP
jgi:hypothetical protein